MFGPPFGPVPETQQRCGFVPPSVEEEQIEASKKPRRGAGFLEPAVSLGQHKFAPLYACPWPAKSLGGKVSGMKKADPCGSAFPRNNVVFGPGRASPPSVQKAGDRSPTAGPMCRPQAAVTLDAPGQADLPGPEDHSLAVHHQRPPARGHLQEFGCEATDALTVLDEHRQIAHHGDAGHVQERVLGQGEKPRQGCPDPLRPQRRSPPASLF